MSDKGRKLSAQSGFKILASSSFLASRPNQLSTPQNFNFANAAHWRGFIEVWKINKKFL
jgi:hypothetical protein